MRKTLLGCAAATACGALLLGPLPVAAAAAAPATDAPAAATEAPPPPDPTTERELKRQARTFHTVGRQGYANSTVSSFAGDVLQGDMSPERVRKGLVEVDTSLDNLLAIIPGGPPGHRANNPLLKATVEAIKKECRKLADARARTDYPGLLAAGTALTTQLSLLTAQSFAGFGIDLAQQIVETVLPPMPPPNRGGGPAQDG
ncbi:hypothetical protein ACFWZ2_22425 [Streptomyces sp. NPDC059002]|uniref:hypothetical protein n=1 Tax=Streptomyces sp. NPDC059002 TaxID=3346690 RepID=UPI0036B8397F